MLMSHSHDVCEEEKEGKAREAKLKLGRSTCTKVDNSCQHLSSIKSGAKMSLPG